MMMNKINYMIILVFKMINNLNTHYHHNYKINNNSKNKNAFSWVKDAENKIKINS